MQAVILAAGKGTRLLPLTEHTPKGLVEIAGKKVLLEAILEALPEEVTELIIVVGHLGDKIKKHFGKSWHKLPIRYVIQDPLDGTGTALGFAKKFLNGRFLVINGDDVYLKEDLERLISHPVGMLIQTTTDEVVYSVILSPEGLVEGFEEKPPASRPHRRVCGAYVLDERFFKYPLAKIKVHGHVEFSLPHTLVELSKDISIHVQEATYWRPVGTMAELERIRGERV